MCIHMYIHSETHFATLGTTDNKVLYIDVSIYRCIYVWYMYIYKWHMYICIHKRIQSQVHSGIKASEYIYICVYIYFGLYSTYSTYSTNSAWRHKSIWINESSVNPKSTSNQSSKPCTVLQYPSNKVRHYLSSTISIVSSTWHVWGTWQHSTCMK